MQCRSIISAIGGFLIRAKGRVVEQFEHPPNALSGLKRRKTVDQVANHIRHGGGFRGVDGGLG